jgi:hypothetical protein
MKSQSWTTNYEYKTPPNLSFVARCFSVGEKVALTFNPEPSAPVKWTIPINQNGTLNPRTGRTTTFTAPSRGGTTSVKVSSGKATNSITFNVLEPTNYHHVVTFATINIPGLGNLPGQAGAVMLLGVYMGPTNVSFSRVEMHEVPEFASNVTGYFTNSTPQALYHGTALSDYFPLGADNSWFDWCWSSTNWSRPWSSGSFTWNVPWVWEVDIGLHPFEHQMTNGWQQVFQLDANGTVRITKFVKNWVDRTTNNVVTVTNMP